MPIFLQKYVVNWYYIYLLHPEMFCTEATISQITIGQIKGKNVVPT